MPVDPNLVILIIALVNAVTAIITWRTHVATKATQSEVVTVRKEMNGMKDALVIAKGESERAAGRDEERALGEAKAAVLAQGKLDQPKVP